MNMKIHITTCSAWNPLLLNVLQDKVLFLALLIKMRRKIFPLSVKVMMMVMMMMLVFPENHFIMHLCTSGFFVCLFLILRLSGAT